ncbi:hypothetical protein CCACVL1_26797 [Corchorus capsularis]|uniref:Post-SET domain-containing protein n=1 Tax=Corchorus capsularis TaxID=210143 RepID=A0A1R3GD91_COCAP|nr:hypothetical protein CCACVL1_26797 [Corchorus capsularis]
MKNRTAKRRRETLPSADVSSSSISTASDADNPPYNCRAADADLDPDLKMIVHLKCGCGAKGCVRLYKSGAYTYVQDELMSAKICANFQTYGGIDRGKAKGNLVSIQKGKTLSSAVDPATFILTSSDADHPAFNFTTSHVDLFEDPYHLIYLISLLETELDPSEYKVKFYDAPHFNPKAVFQDPGYPKVVTLREHAVDRSEFHKEMIGWWIQKEDLPEDDLKMVVHLKCQCGAKGCVYWYNDEHFTYYQDELIAVLSRKYAYFGTCCSCPSYLSWCGIAREAVEEIDSEKKIVSVHTPKILPLAYHPTFDFTATDLGLFRYFYFFYFVLMLEGKLDRSQYVKVIPSYFLIFPFLLSLQIKDPEYYPFNTNFSGEPEPHPNPNAVFKYGDFPTVITLCRPSLDRSEFEEESIGWWIQKEKLPRDDLKMIVHLKCYCGAHGCVGCYKDGGFSWSKGIQFSLVLVQHKDKDFLVAFGECRKEPANQVVDAVIAIANEEDRLNMVIPSFEIVSLDSGYPRVATTDPKRSEFYQERIGWWIQKTKLPEDLKMIVHLKCECGAKGSVSWYKNGFSAHIKEELVSAKKLNFAFFGTNCSCKNYETYCGIEIGKPKGNLVSIHKGKTLPSAVDPLTNSILIPIDADHPAFNFTASHFDLFGYPYHVINLISLLESELDPSEYNKGFPAEPIFNPKAVFQDPGYPKVVTMRRLAVDRSEFHNKTIGWWIQKKDLPEDDLKMVVHLECECGAKGCVYWYNDEHFSYCQDELIAVVSKKYAYFGTCCSCKSHLSWCGIAREAVEEIEAEKKSAFIQTPKVLPLAYRYRPVFDFTATDLGLFQYFYFYYFVLMLEGKLDRSEYIKIRDPECLSFDTNIYGEPLPHPNPKQCSSMETIGWWIQKKDLPRDDLKMIVHLKCYCGDHGCVGCYKDGGFSWSKDEISAVVTGKVAYFATSCMCGCHTTHCGIARDKSIDEFLAAGG